MGNSVLVLILFQCCILRIGLSQLPKQQRETCSVNNTCLKTASNDDSAPCPVMFQCNNSSKCECINTLDWIVLCNEDLQVAAAIDCHCITYDSKTSTIMAGSCLAQCGIIRQKRNQDNNAYYDLPRNINELNSSECGHWNRDGLLCGQCKEDYYPQAYSYNLTCIGKDECKGKYGDWWKYILAAYGPLTIFCFIILLLRINVTSSYLLAYVVFSQTVTSPFFSRPVFSLSSTHGKIQLGLKILGSMYSMWSLDFFKSAYTICLKLDGLTIVTLEYCIALYPFLLTFISYQAIKIYDRKIPFVVSMWKPIKWLFSSFHKNVDSRTTVIDAYATFFLLSYSKITTISFTLLTPTPLQNVTTKETKLVLLYDGTKEYFHSEHLPYGLIALLMCCTFNLLPFAILLFYHNKWFQILLSYLPCKHLAFKMTMDLLQCCYKDGTEPGTKDCRWFSATFLAYWMVTYAGYAVTLDAMFYIYGAIYCVLFLALLTHIQPYKEKYSHFHHLLYTLSVLLAVLFLLAVGLSLANITHNDSVTEFIFILCLIFVLIPHILIIVYTLYWLISHCPSN